MSTECGPERDHGYLCRLWTPPSIWADVVLFSNFRSPEYIMALQGEEKYIWSGSPGSCPWHPRRSIHLEPHWWQPGESPSSLERPRGDNR
uniref:Uncharacterized protein n=1 Tax=Oncorhynchus kisutch TaxID=8019 RepID=A0A8C7L4J1_ONCKI